MSRRLPALLLVWLASAAPVAWAGDRDGDGIGDEHEAILGTDPAAAETLRVVLDDGLEPEERRREPRYDATKDFLKVECAHVAGDRYLWRATFPVPPRLEDTVFHLYLDADANAKTGRKGEARASFTGTEYMLSVVGGRGWSHGYEADGGDGPSPVVTHVVQGNTLLVTADVALGRDTGGARYALYVLCHTTTRSGAPAKMSDSSGKKLVAGIPLTGRKKILRPCDYSENHGVDATFGTRLLRKLLRAKHTVAVRHDQLELDGFEVDQFTSRRWPHLKRLRHNARAWATAPRPGRYHVGFMMVDDSRDDRVSVHIDGTLCGVAVGNQDNNRTWLYWLREARDFKGGERVELRGVGASGTHGVINLLFLPRPPKIRTIRYAVEHMTAVSHVDNPRRVILSWATTWPCATRFEWAPNTTHRTYRTYPTEDSAQSPCLVHRAVLDGLDPKLEYQGRAIGTTRDGEPFRGPDFVFRAQPPVPPPTRKGVHAVPLAVRNPHPFAIEQWPITTGIPFPKGELASTDHVRLVGGGGEVPAQVRLTARWGDGSVKWLLVTFLADAPAGGASTYRLEYGARVRRAAVSGAVAAAKAAWATLATDAEGTSYSTAGGKAQLRVEEAGPVRSVVKSVGYLTSERGEKLLRIEQRIEAWRGLPWVRVHHTLVVERPEAFTEIKELSVRVPVRAEGRTWGVALADGTTLPLGVATPRVWQRFHNELVAVTGGREMAEKGRIRGSAVSGGPGGCAVAVRDAWQNYPKGFSLRPDGLYVELCPAFKPGLYDRFPFEKEGHHLYYYLLNGLYKLKRGVAKTHELMLCHEPDETRRERLCALFQRPLLATAPPEWYCGSGAFYDVAPRDETRFPLYEQAIDKNLAAYAARRERQRDFGMLNYGDWYGERGSNWGNIEYDTQHAFFLEYIRSGNPLAFFLGDATEIHNRDVDTVQWSPDPRQVGAVYIHQMGHVGGYYTRSVPGTLGFPRAGYTVSHAWTEGHFEHYFLTGDRRSWDTGCAVTDFFIRKQLGRPYDFRTTRVPGWHLIMLAAAYHATGDPYYLNAAKVIVERVLETQDVEPRPLPEYQRAGRKPYQVGGWSRMMVPGHCHCEPRHRGNAGFMVAVLLSGLKYYHDVTDDPRVKECIIRGAHYLLDECYSDQTKGFRYTSCPKTRYGHGASPLMVEGVARAYLWTKDARLRRCLVDALPRRARGSGYGKGFSMYYRMAPRLLADLAAAGITLEEK